jgi:hypothetical protein
MVGEEPLRAPEGSIPSLLNKPLGSNIQHILEDIDMELEDSVGMADDNMGPSPLAAMRVPRKALSPISKTGKSSRVSTPKGPRSLTPTKVEKEIDSRRSRASEALEASGFESTAEIQSEGANWTVGGKLAKLGGNFKGNPFKAVVDLINHEGLHLKRDITLQGVAEEMLTMQCLVGIHYIPAPTFFFFFLLLTSCLS